MGSNPYIIACNKLINPLHPKFPAGRLAVAGRKNRVRHRSTPLRLRSLPGVARRDGAANGIHKWPHPQTSWDIAYAAAVSLYHTSGADRGFIEGGVLFGGLGKKFCHAHFSANPTLFDSQIYRNVHKFTEMLQCLLSWSGFTSKSLRG